MRGARATPCCTLYARVLSKRPVVPVAAVALSNCATRRLFRQLGVATRVDGRQPSSGGGDLNHYGCHVVGAAAAQRQLDQLIEGLPG